MHTPKTILRGLVIAGAVLPLGFVAGPGRAVGPPPARCEPAVAIDPAILSQIARAQAAVTVSEGAGAASRWPFGL